MAFLDDVYAVTPSPDRVGAIYTSIQENLWNGAGSKPDICEVLHRVVQVADPEAKVWKGSEVPPNQQGLNILGAPFGHREYIAAQLERFSRNKRPSSKGFHSFQICKLCGSSCCIAQVPGQIACSERWTPCRCCSTHSCTTNDCGTVCVTSWELRLVRCRREEHSHFASGSWRVGSEKCSQDQGGGVVGELG